jgi:Lhr-like helicase
MLQIHVLNESRGSTLEVVISRMKTRGAAVRFVLVSATVPNIEDVATWIGTNGSLSKPATVLEESQIWDVISLRSSAISLVKSTDLVSSPESWSGFIAQRDKTILCFPKCWTANCLQRCNCIQWESLSWSSAPQEMVI